MTKVLLPPEKLGSFYLGAKYDIDNKELSSESVNYDARDLTTHAVCVGMTGSGKTGLCIGLLEEAAIDKVPALIIDPKGDMTNLLLQFEDLNPSDFEQFINSDDAGRKGMSVADYAASMAEKWESGIGSWGQTKERIKMLKNSVDYTIYTPGSDSGVPVNIMGSFAAPGVDFDSDAEMLRERIQGTVAALLGMVDHKDDPVRSREGILLATLFEYYWRKHEDLDLTKIIKGVQNPPFSTLGVFEVDTFFPEKDRFSLAMEFNTLIASPQFSYWLQGDALDIEKLYFTAEGKPRHSIFYIAHLSESERMFFVTLLLNSLITWMRRQSGTTSLRSLVYFDEVFGYFPPTANPPSKKPLLTILKQARAFGVGAVLVTQNPVDIDYKGLSNAGTWFIGKLQTERDKDRVLDGLKGAIAEAGGAGKTDFSKLITQLGSRVFLLHNVHEDEPVVYHTRWAMSYLRGPMTRPQVKELMQAKKQSSTVQQEKVSEAAIAAPVVANTDQNQSPKHSVTGPPSLDPKIDARFFSVWKSESEATSFIGERDLKIIYEPEILALGQVRFYDQKRKVDEFNTANRLSTAPDSFGRCDWQHAPKLDQWERALTANPDHPDSVNVTYASISDSMNSEKELNKVEKDYADWLYNHEKHIILEHLKLGLTQEANESAESFRMRAQQAAREDRDEELDDLRDRYETKFEALEKKIRKEEYDLEEAETELRDRKNAEMIGMAETLVSVFLKGRSRSLSSAATKNRMKKKARIKVEEAEQDLEDLQSSKEAIDEELKEKLDEVTKKWDQIAGDITEKEIRPRRTDVQIDKVIFAWHPYWVGSNGKRYSARA